MKYIKKYITELKETIPMMESKDYKERFRAEYWQAVVRYQKLDSMLAQWDLGILDFEPVCPKPMLEKQLGILWDYIQILRDRAELEGIELNKEDNEDDD